MEPNYENSTAAAKGCYWNEPPFSNENERNTHNSTLPDINLLSTKNGLDFGVHLTESNTRCPVIMYGALDPGSSPEIPCSTDTPFNADPSSRRTIGMW